MPRVAPVALLVLALAASSSLLACGGDDEPEQGLAAPGSVTPPQETTAPAPASPTTVPGAEDPASPGASGTTTLQGPGADPPPKEPPVSEVQRPSKPLRCPAAGAPKGEGGTTSAGGFDARDLLGLSTAQAQALAKRHDCVVRVVNRDGQDLVRTMDYSNARVNVTETKGRVVRLDGIG